MIIKNRAIRRISIPTAQGNLTVRRYIIEQLHNTPLWPNSPNDDWWPSDGRRRSPPTERTFTGKAIGHDDVGLWDIHVLRDHPSSTATIYVALQCLHTTRASGARQTIGYRALGLCDTRIHEFNAPPLRPMFPLESKRGRMLTSWPRIRDAAHYYRR